MDETKCGVEVPPQTGPYQTGPFQTGPFQAGPFQTGPRQTEALRRVLAQPMHRSAVADYLFLEAWERSPSDNAGVALRIGQIRRANRQLADEIRPPVTAELKRTRPGFRTGAPAKPR